ncbi:MAG: LytTR family transcriptional regulator DNA-binding domain-containing protein [Flavobacteriaceae bacterium]|nr:LytTR family transcriptional regulator DNA-binding domain-containing protein [Flavobacteriaceae bacterium]
MRFYQIIGNIPAALESVIPVFDESGEFKCLGRTVEKAINWEEALKFPPELVIINLDDPNIDVFKIIGKYNNRIGIIPNYIGITSSHEKGFEAFQLGFVYVILAPLTMEKILAVLYKYKRTYAQNHFFCIDYYRDFFYLNLHELLLVKADNYTTEFLMRDGSLINNFKNLKHTHPLLPFNFQRINRSYVVNSFYVSRIHTGKNELHLRHYNQPLHYTKKYSENIIHIKKMLLKAPSSVFV